MRPKPRFLLVGKRAVLELLDVAYTWEQAMEGAFAFSDDCKDGVLVIDVDEQKARLVRNKNQLHKRVDNG